MAPWEAADYLRNCLHYWIKVKSAELDNALLFLENHLLELFLEPSNLYTEGLLSIDQVGFNQEPIEQFHQETDFTHLDFHPSRKSIVKKIERLP